MRAHSGARSGARNRLEMQNHTASPRRVLHRIAALGVATLVAAGLSLAAASPALAHDELVGTNAVMSEDGTTVAVTLSFSNDIMEVGSELIASGPDGADLLEGTPVISGRDVTQELRMPGIDQPISVAWRVVSSDGHPISGAFTLVGSETENGVKWEFGEPELASDGEQPADESQSADEPGEMTTQSASETSSLPFGAWIAIAAALAIAAIATVVAMRRKKNTPATAEGATQSERAKNTENGETH